MLAPGKHYVNSPLRLTLTLKDASGNAYDPTTVTIRLMSPPPYWVETDYVYGTDSQLTRISAGVYAADVTPDAAGRWDFRWETTGGVIADEGAFLVQYSRFYDDINNCAYRLP